MSRWVAAILLTLTVTGMVVGLSQYSITVADGIDTPDTEVTIDGSAFTVRGIAEVASGESLTASVVVPADNDGYRVYIYGSVDGSREIIDAKYRDSGSSVTFDTSGFDPGTYTLALHTAGDYQAVYPFIVTGATADLTAPSTAIVGNTITLDAAISTTDPHVDVAGVEFVIYGDGVSKRRTATATSTGYSVRLDTSDLPPGEYTVYAIVQNDSSTPMGNPEPIGLSTQQTLSLEAESTTTGGQHPTASTTTPPGENTTTPTPTTITTPTPTTITTPTPTTITTTTTTPVTTTTTTMPPTTVSRTGSTTPSASTSERTTGPAGTSDAVLEPNTRTTTDTSAPGLSLGASVLAVLVAALVRVQRD